MTVLLLFLMAYQVTGEVAHEYIGVAMTLTVIVHQILNRKWYGVLFKGRYNACRILSTTLTILLLISFAMTAFCGMAMSGYAVPFLYGMAPVHLARQIHLAMSHWSFILMGLHLGVHVPATIAGMKMNKKTKTVCRFLFACMAGFGLYLFLKAGMAEYMLFQVPFAFLDYEKSALQVFAENMVMLGGMGIPRRPGCRALSEKARENHADACGGGQYRTGTGAVPCERRNLRCATVDGTGRNSGKNSGYHGITHTASGILSR